MTTKPELVYQYECPVCGSHRLNIAVSRNVVVQFTSNDDHKVVQDDDGNTEFDDSSPAVCTNCDFSGNLRVMQPKR